MDIFQAMEERKSARAYLKREVPRREIETILNFAGRAPSAINLQPWEFVIVYGEEKERLVRRLMKARSERAVACGPGTSRPLPGKFSRRSLDALAVMEPDIAALGMTFNGFIEEGSCSFYGAPVAVIVTIDRIFPQIRYLDVGMAVSYFLLAAHGRGLAACPIGLVTAYGEEISQALNIPEEKEIILAIALGYADETSPANRFKTARAPLDEIAQWYE